MVQVGLFANFNTVAADTGDLYYMNSDSRGFKLESMENATRAADSDIYFNYFRTALIGENGTSIKDLGSIDYESAKAPATGYSTGEIKVVTDHVYAIKCGRKGFYLLKATNVISESEVEFTARLAEPEKNINLYYMNEDSRGFVFESMENVTRAADSDIYFNYFRTVLFGENGASIKDLGSIDYDSAKAPVTGYSTEEIKVVTGHVYAVKCGSKGYYLLKATAVISESEVEFSARLAEMQSPDINQEDKDAKTVQPDEDVNADTSKEGVEEDKITDRAQKKDLYWVENGSKLVLGGKILFEDSNGIIEPLLSPNKKYIVYASGSYEYLQMYDIAKKTNKKLYALKDKDQVNYCIIPVGWSQDSKKVSFRTAYRGGFTGSNKLFILTLSNKKVSTVAQGLSSADWGSNGKFVIADGTDVWLVDKLGRNKVSLKVPTARAFFGADDVSITPDGKTVIYIVGSSYYLHDIKANKYKKLSIPEEAASNGTVRAGKDGTIAVINDRKIYIYDPEDEDYGLLYEDADSSYVNWIDK